MTDAPADIIIRTPRTGDLDQVAAMERRSFADPWAREALAQELTADRLRLPLVAEVQGRIVGYLMAWKIVDQLHVLNIASEPDFRRRGVGTALLRAAAREAAAAGMVEVTLEVRASNQAARAFYLGHGFQETGLRRGYYADNGEDAIIMTCGTAGLLGA